MTTVTSPLQALVSELCAIPIGGPDATGGCVAGPPASAEVLATAETTLGRPLPGELLALLAVTGEITGPDFGFDFNPVAMNDLGLGPLFQIYDYGNGDGWYLEPRGNRCVSWWCGHDPYYLVRLDDSLEAWLRRATAHLEAWRTFEQSDPSARLPEPLPLMAPQHEVAPITAGTLLARSTDPGLIAFLESLPSRTEIYDLRDATGPVEAAMGPPWKRYGDVVAAGAGVGEGVGEAPTAGGAPPGRAPRPPAPGRPARDPDAVAPIPQEPGNLVAPLARRLWELGWEAGPPAQATQRGQAFADQLGLPLPTELRDWLHATQYLLDPTDELLLSPRKSTQEGERSVWMISMGGWRPNANDLFWQPVDGHRGALWLRRNLRLYPLDTSLVNFLTRLVHWTQARTAPEGSSSTPLDLIRPGPGPGDELQLFGATDDAGELTAGYQTLVPTEPTPPNKSRHAWWKFWRKNP